MRLLISMLCVLMLSGCGSSVEHFLSNRSQQVSTAVGAGVGAGTAAALSANNPISMALVATGASVGYHYQSIRRQAGILAGYGGQVLHQGDYWTIVVPTNVIYEPSHDSFLRYSKKTERSLAAIMSIVSGFPNMAINVSVNTNGLNSEAIDLQLSERRAKMMADYLKAEGLQHVTYAGYGDSQPIGLGHTTRGLLVNSRLQITIYPPQHLVMDHTAGHEWGEDTPNPEIQNHERRWGFQ